jgi:hypothetical protein
MGAAKQYAGGANGPLEISSAERSGAALGGWSLVLSLGVLAVRVAFGSPSREFFDSPPGRDVPVDV